MSKITRKKLARGSILNTEHVFPPLADASTPADADQVKVGWAPFRVNFNFPLLNDAAGAPGPEPTGKPLSIPFTLPPLQREFNANGVAGRTNPTIVLDEIFFSFDSMAETGALIFSGGEYKPDMKAAEKCSVDISILEKNISLTETRYDKEVVSFRIPGIGLAGSTTERLNPVSVTNLGCVLDPYKMYMMQVSMPDAYSHTDRLHMPNVNVSLRLRHPITAGTARANIQNAPDPMYGADSTSSIDAPTSGDQVNASGAKGVDTEISRVDDMYLSKLNAGMDTDSSVDAIRHLAACSGYEVIAVPMFQNPLTIHQKTWERLPYVDEFGQKSSMDRRIIPIVHPLVIHHVIAVSNHNDTYPAGGAGGAEVQHPNGTNMNPTSGLHSTQMPSSATLKYHLGVAIGRGIRSDSFTYQQVADHEWNPGAAASASTIDYSSSGSLWSDKAFQTISVPLHGTGGGVGHKTTGMPIFAGKGQASTRSTIGSNPSETLGAEQFIEVRWLIDDSAGLNVAAGLPGNPNTPGDVFVGTGGHWVYIICEKRLAGERATHG